jgi:signal transduction histidine kinase/ActR/RegA family two-component response regulator
MKKAFLIVTIVWLLVVGISLVWNLEHAKRDHEQITLQAARSFFRLIVLPRTWNASHDGIYGVVTEEVQPNPYLKAPLRDVVTTNGLELTMLNPATMMRKIAEIAAQEENIQFHITSLKPINPANKPTVWETEWLNSFEQGEVERFEIIHQKSGSKFRYMAPVCIEENCLKCHAEQGYKKGDIRGAISATLPYIEKTTSPLWVGHGATALIGLAGIFLAGSLLGHSRRNLIESNKQQRELFAKLQQAQKMEAIGTLAGGIAHDFNNILTAILGYSELALIEMDDIEVMRKYIVRVKAGAERASALVTQILTFSRSTEEEKQPLLIAPLVKEALKLLRSSIPATIDIKQDITSQGVVVADSTQIHQIVMNLCTNAYYAMRETGGTLGITVKDIELPDLRAASQLDLAPGKYIHLEITDTGIGMDAKTKEKIFEPYFTTKEVGEGTGLGLAVVHAIVQSHNGRIIVSSEPGEGTTFHIYFPIAEGEKAVEVQKELETPLTGGDEIIMLVDDEKINVELTKDILTMHGYTVFTFTNGVQAFQEFQQELGKYDLVITDMTMPYMTGTQLSQKILATRPNLPIILCTGHSNLTNREKALAMGIKEYCQKPLKMRKLLCTVREVLDRAKIKDA